LAQPHALVLNLAPGVQGTLARTNELLAVVSGSTRFSVSGDAAVNAWRFAVDSSATGNAAPIIVFKYAPGAMQYLARNPHLFAYSAELNEDADGTSVRLQTLIATVISNAQLPEGAAYAQLAQDLQDPSWTGVLIFNASASVPGEVLGQSTGALAGTHITAFDIGFQANNMPGASPGIDAFFGTVDYTTAPGGTPTPGGQYLRALFANNALTSFEMG